MRFENQVVVITGATGGLGEALARAFAKENAKVVVAARKADLGEKLASEIGNKAFFCEPGCNQRKQLASAYT